jgi:hypothetical protein
MMFIGATRAPGIKVILSWGKIREKPLIISSSIISLKRSLFSETPLWLLYARPSIKSSFLSLGESGLSGQVAPLDNISSVLFQRVW